jgi:hypothetical protein
MQYYRIFKMKSFRLLSGIFIGFLALLTSPVIAQSGDQILNGTGETGLMARNEFPDTTPQLYNQFLTGVTDVQVETVVGYLPDLPRYVRGIYRNNFQGPDVRVIWPAPVDNSQVLTSGTYTVTGKVAGTDIYPKAIVTVKNAEVRVTPDRRLEAFRLDQVILNTDIHNNNTKFIENRDKFLKGLTSTNPDNFLYMFRNAFGQEQPEGAKPLGGGIVSKPNCVVMPLGIILAP